MITLLTKSVIKETISIYTKLNSAIALYGIEDFEVIDKETYYTINIKHNSPDLFDGYEERLYTQWHEHIEKFLGKEIKVHLHNNEVANYIRYFIKNGENNE
jgi:ribosomal protein S3